MASYNEPSFHNLDGDSEITIIQSLCLSCQGEGETRLLLTKIPYFRDVILTSFSCECGYKNTSYQSGSFQERGLKYKLDVVYPEDLSRRLAISEYAVVSIPKIELEIPPNGEKAEVSTIEGILKKTIDDLRLDQDSRKELNPELAEQIEEFIDKLELLLTLEDSFLVIVDDPAGNSYVEDLKFPLNDSQLSKTFYERTFEQNTTLGINQTSTDCEDEEGPVDHFSKAFGEQELKLDEEVHMFQTNCDQCSKPSKTKMKLTTIPYFKDVIIMASECDHCGHRSNEVKSGGGINEKGKRMTLHLTNAPLDMTRDVLKSETCSIKIPEMDLSVGAGVLVGKFTTVEGLLSDIKEDLKNNPFLMGDSTSHERKDKMESILCNLDKIIDGSKVVHLVLDDPVGNSYMQSLSSPPEKDPQILIEEYERSFDQNEELGLNDIKTENYAN